MCIVPVDVVQATVMA